MQDQIIASHTCFGGHTTLNVSDDLKWTTNIHVTPFTLISGITDNIYVFLPVHPYFYPSTTVFTRPNDGWTGLCITL